MSKYVNKKRQYTKKELKVTSKHKIVQTHVMKEMKIKIITFAYSQIHKVGFFFNDHS